MSADATAAPAEPSPPTAVALFATALGLAAAGLALFYFAGQSYYASRLGTTAPPNAVAGLARDAMMSRLPGFATFAVVAAVGVAAALRWARPTSIVVVGLGALINLTAVAVGHAAMPTALDVFLLVLAAAFAGFGWSFAARQSRIAWASLAAMTGVLALMTFFGAPKVADLAGVNVWFAMVLPATYIVGMLALRHCAPRE